MIRCPVQEACGMVKPIESLDCLSAAGLTPARPSSPIQSVIPDSHPGGLTMTALRFARVVLPSLALSLGSIALPAGAAALEDDEVFAQEMPDAGGPATRRLDDRRRANDGDWFRAPVQQGPQDFPSNEIHDAVVANTRAATARAMFRRAESAMHAAARDAEREFQQSAELKQAVAAEQKAYDAFQDARRDALRDVVGNPRYQAMQDFRE